MTTKAERAAQFAMAQKRYGKMKTTDTKTTPKAKVTVRPAGDLASKGVKIKWEKKF